MALRDVLAYSANDRSSNIHWSERRFRFVQAEKGEEHSKMPGDPDLEFILTEDKSDIEGFLSRNPGLNIKSSTI